MNRKTVQSIAIIAIFITGALLLFYPLVSNWWNERRYDMLVSGYAQRVQVNPSGEDYGNGIQTDRRVQRHFARQKAFPTRSPSPRPKRTPNTPASSTRTPTA